MKKIVVVLTIIALCCSEEATHRRVKRKVLFTKNSKLFLRINGKANVIPWNQIFAHGWAFRVNWELPETSFKRHQFFKREIQSARTNLKTVQGYSCILKQICQLVTAIKFSSKCGVLCKIGSIISNSNGVDVDFFQTVHTLCDEYAEDCHNLFNDSTNTDRNIL